MPKSMRDTTWLADNWPKPIPYAKKVIADRYELSFKYITLQVRTLAAQAMTSKEIESSAFCLRVSISFKLDLGQGALTPRIWISTPVVNHPQLRDVDPLALRQMSE